MSSRHLLHLVAVVLAVLTAAAAAREHVDADPPAASSADTTSSADNDAFPVWPFQRALKLGDTGSDVTFLRLFLQRTVAPGLSPDAASFDAPTQTALEAFAKKQGLASGPALTPALARLLLRLGSADHFRPPEYTARSRGFLYKLVVPVHANRSRETEATLFDADDQPLYSFRVRAHGHAHIGKAPWPEFDNSGTGVNQWSPSGATPTGLMEVDLQSPEDDPKTYGPYPVNRVVRGIEGNARWILGEYGHQPAPKSGPRSGILLHTGRWQPFGWKDNGAMNMPNSAGCLHAWPEAVNTVWHMLTQRCGVNVTRNTDGDGSAYPFRTQGLLVVHEIDD